MPFDFCGSCGTHPILALTTLKGPWSVRASLGHPGPGLIRAPAGTNFDTIERIGSQ